MALFGRFRFRWFLHPDQWPHIGWSISNWLHGYRFGPVRRCRWCDHTWPHHYATCLTTDTEEGD